jgi:cytohesin|tara:strand:- start:3580 stop:3948 length:369 start_codon:yes stop_codon:yes gene_type:complete
MKHIIITTIAAVLLVGCSGPPPKDIWEATKQGDVDAVKQFIVAGEDVNAKDNNGVSPLHYAAYYGEKEVAELLIAKGADVNAKDEDAETPLDNAIMRKHPETADLLRKHGGKTAKELKAEGK